MARLDEHLQPYDEHTQMFNIGDNLLCFKHEDVAFILGLCCVGELMVFHKEKKNSHHLKTNTSEKSMIGTKMSSKESFSILFERKEENKTLLSY